jgi:hypothetical protein
MRISSVAGSTNSLNSTSTIHIFNYANTTTFKTAIGRGNITNSEVNARVGLWRSTSPITSVNLLAQEGSATWAVGTTFTLYGIKAAATQFIPVNAAGGDYAVSDGTYAYHVFKSSGFFTPAKSLSCDVLVVAGGGGGGYDGGGGGGAGGLRGFTSQSLSATSYTVTVGAGGAASTTAGSKGATGGTSTFGSNSSSGGGGGGSDANPAGANGGSGGGGRLNRSSNGAGTGNAGGYSPSEGNSGVQRVKTIRNVLLKIPIITVELNSYEEGYMQE